MAALTAVSVARSPSRIVRGSPPTRRQRLASALISASVAGSASNARSATHAVARSVGVLGLAP
jgi:hypothetical protein